MPDGRRLRPGLIIILQKIFKLNRLWISLIHTIKPEGDVIFIGGKNGSNRNFKEALNTARKFTTACLIIKYFDGRQV